MLGGEIQVTKMQKIAPKRKEVTFIDLLKKTTAYKKYSQNKKEEISNSEILEALRTPASAPEETIEKHFKKYLEYAYRINDLSAIEFLEFVQRQFGGSKK